MAKMSIRQRRFCHIYLKNGGDAKKAVVEAGYNPNPLYVKQLGYKILNTPAVKLYVEKAIRKMEKDFGITFDWKLKKLKRVVDDNIPDAEEKPIIDANVGVKAIAELNKMQGDYAVAKSENTNLNVHTDAEIKDVQELIKQNEREY